MVESVIWFPKIQIQVKCYDHALLVINPKQEMFTPEGYSHIVRLQMPS